MDNEEIGLKLVEHEFALEKFSDALTVLNETNKDTNSQLSDIAKSMGKQELILEKISNMDDKFKDSVNRIHKRIDNNESILDKMEKSRNTTGCPVIQRLQLDVDNEKAKTKQLEDDKRWITRLLIGKVIVIVIGAVYMLKGGA